ncbi:MAG TPA: multicopper oxidase domain-containing protein, partial [Solirubrobacteraceae bacterium]|nr:multicopper oxidase domain-containing protein [Solirubrobacteraceae bacterium]
MIAVGLVGLGVILAIIVSVFAFANGGSGETTTVVKRAASAGATAPAKAPTLAQAKGVSFEKFAKVDPTLPAVPPGAVKKFTVDVFQHVTQVDPNLAPTEAWSYAVNGKTYRGTAASPPIVVNQGDKVQITFVNGGSKKMAVNMAHSIDFHAAEVAPNKNYIDVAPGKKLTIDFVAKHPGVFMYHCATQPVLMHTSAGMMGMMVVKPRNLPPVDKELWLTQEEFYLGAPGKPADMNKMNAETPDVMAFNGYANQYKANPITVRRGERIRMYILDAGPSKWSAFHVIGTVFDRTYVEGVVGHDSQTVSLAPSQGGWVEFTLDQQGNFPFVTHAFGDMVKGAAGILHTTGAPKVAAPAPPATTGHDATAEGADVTTTLGEMWVKADTTTLNAGHVHIAVKNTGATTHGLAIVADPPKAAGGMLDESTFLVKGKELAPGASETVMADLKPGRYEFVCFMPGHFAAGQKLPFVVK